MTNWQLVSFCKKAALKKTRYMWGCYGQKITETLIANKSKQYPTRYSAERQALLRRSEGHGVDCAGLIKWFLWTNGAIEGSLKYDSNTDCGATGFYDRSKKRGKIATMPELVGIGLFKQSGSSMGHVGVYLGNGRVAESTLGARGDGVVITDIKACKWTHWGYLPFMTYTATEKTVTGNEAWYKKASVENALPKISVAKTPALVRIIKKFMIDK